jgi:hypothetical protein
MATPAGDAVTAWSDANEKIGLLIESANPVALADVLGTAHEGVDLIKSVHGKTWPDRDALTFALNYLRQVAARPRDRRSPMPGAS